jgi:hypothetical protein
MQSEGQNLFIIGNGEKIASMRPGLGYHYFLESLSVTHLSKLKCRARNVTWS